MANDKVVAALVKALSHLRGSSFWRDLLLENIYCASYESFVQSSLLGAINGVKGKGFYCDRERRVVFARRRIAPDLWLLDRTKKAWMAWDDVKQTPVKDRAKTMAKLTKGVIEVKVAWTEGWAYGSARPAERVKTIADAVRSLGAPATSPWSPVPRFVLVVIGGVFECSNETFLDAETKRIKTAVAAVNGSALIPIGPKGCFPLAPLRNLGGGEYVGTRAMLFRAR